MNNTEIMTESTIYYDKNGVIIREAQISDALIVSKSLRESDTKEVWASHHYTPEKAVFLSFESSSFCLVVENKSIPLSLFGVSPQSLLSNSALIWLLATETFDALIKKNRKEFIGQSKIFINLMLRQYPLLENYVDIRNISSMKWLKLCGATFEEPKPYGVEGRLFRYFYFTRNENET